jgi:hypothetical protein
MLLLEMEAWLAKFDERPRWARNWCYFYLLTSLLTAITAVLTLLLLIFGFSEFSRRGAVWKVLLYSFVFIAQGTTSMVMFWTCRSALQ